MDYVQNLINKGNIIDHVKNEADTLEVEAYEPKEYSINGLPSALHFYYLNNKLLEGEEVLSGIRVPRKRSLSPLMQSATIQSILYVPFMKAEMIKMHRYNYDQKYYGSVSENPKSTLSVQGVHVYKIEGLKSGQKDFNYKLGTVDKYETKKFGTRTGKRSWKNESKLFQFPYHFINIQDHMNAPLQIAINMIEGSEEYKNGKTFDVNVRQAFSINGSYTLYVPYLKGDPLGKNEGIKSASPMDLPVSSSQYAQYMANNKAQHTTNNVMAITNSLLGNNGRIGQAAQNYAFGQSMIKGAEGWTNEKDQFGYPIYKNDKGAKSKGNIMMKAALGSAGGEIGSRLINTATTIAQIQAKKTDMMNAPRNVTLQGGDVMDSITNGDKKIDAIRYHIKEEYLQRLGDFFAMYGYAQNKMMKINLRSRKDYNYIKTVGANITGTIPKKHIESLKAIFNNGITLWHMDRNGGKFIDYSDDNTEV